VSNKKTNPEYERFDRTMTELLKVPHELIKAKLDAEKVAKEKRKPKTSAHAGGPHVPRPAFA
jgi:hypothetical protein